MRSQISKPMPLRNWSSTNMGPFKYSLFSTRSAREFQTFHSELSVVWVKGSLVTNIIESKRYYSPLILHSVRVLQKKICVWIHKKNKRFVETVLLSTHETLHIKMQLLKSKNSVFASSANMSKLLLYSDDLYLKWDVCETGRQVPVISVADESLGEMFSPRVSTLSIHSLEKFAYMAI